MNYLFLALFIVTALSALVAVSNILSVIFTRKRFPDAWGVPLNIGLTAVMGSLAAWFFTLI